MEFKIKYSERNKGEYVLLLLIFLGWTALVSLAACKVIQSPKINFPLEDLDKKGLSGKGDGKVAVSYEFCLPKDAILKEKVAQIDSTVTFSNARGRIGCDQKKWLCLGHTAQPNFKKVLAQLAALPEVERIDRAWFE